MRSATVYLPDGTILLPLREKYLTRKTGSGGRYQGRAGNSHGKKEHTIEWHLSQKVKKLGGGSWGKDTGKKK